jgi:hypothetical protein
LVICRAPSRRLPPVDGILMANTLHFIQEQQAQNMEIRSRRGAASAKART